MCKEIILQSQIIDNLINYWGDELYIPIYSFPHNIIPHTGCTTNTFIRSYFVKNNEEDLTKIMQGSDIDVTSFEPGFAHYGDGSVIYNKFNNEINAEPLIIERNFNGLKDDKIEVLEEFRLIFNLYYDESKKIYYDLKNDTPVIKIEDSIITVHKKYLKEYLAIKNICLILFIDNRVFFNDQNIFENLQSENLLKSNCIETNYRYDLSIAQNDPSGDEPKYFSMLYGKKIIFPIDVSHCDIWPYNENKQKEYENFIMGSDDKGNPIKFSCNPANLNNFFNPNTENPHYLTPIFFKPEVLKKYLDDDRYTVEDGIIRYGSIWSLYIDNQLPDCVSAYLGDLGRDLPYIEQKYWASFNILDGNISQVRYKRDFLVQATEPSSPIFRLQNKYKEVNNLFFNQFNTNILLELSKQDQYNLDSLHLPSDHSISDLDKQVLSLTKVLIDSLNENWIKANLNMLRISEANLKGISALEKLFQTNNVANYSDHIQFLRNLQNLRSSGSGHRKGDNYKKCSKKFNISENNYRQPFIEILEKSILFLEFLKDNITIFKKQIIVYK